MNGMTSQTHHFVWILSTASLNYPSSSCSRVIVMLLTLDGASQHLWSAYTWFSVNTLPNIAVIYTHYDAPWSIGSDFVFKLHSVWRTVDGLRSLMPLLCSLFLRPGRWYSFRALMGGDTTLSPIIMLSFPLRQCKLFSYHVPTISNSSDFMCISAAHLSDARTGFHS